MVIFNERYKHDNTFAMECEWMRESNEQNSTNIFMHTDPEVQWPGSGRVIWKRRLVMEFLVVSKSVSFGQILFALFYEMPDQTRLCFEPIKTLSSV